MTKQYLPRVSADTINSVMQDFPSNLWTYVNRIQRENPDFYSFMMTAAEGNKSLEFNAITVYMILTKQMEANEMGKNFNI